MQSAQSENNDVIPVNDFVPMRLQHWLFLLFWILKPFYLWESGTMQISDFIFVLSFLIMAFDRRGMIEFERTHLYFLFFVLGTLLVNSVYTAMHANRAFLMASAYYVYNTLMIVAISEFKNNDTFLKALMRASIFNIVAQLVILLFGQGRFYFDTPRYMGTFNDPNQFAFSIFTSFLLIFVLAHHFRMKGEGGRTWLLLCVFALSFYLIARSNSTGMLLGIASFVLFWLLNFIFSGKTQAFRMLQITLIATAFLAVLYAALKGVDTNQIHSQNDLVVRLLEKIDKVDTGGLVALVEERGLDKLFNYPVYNILGAGDGLYRRFVDSALEVEVHSTLPGALFYYGIVPFTLLIVWLVSMMRGTAPVLIPAFLSMLVESFTLANQRQPIFWMIIVLCGLTAQNDLSVHEQGRGLRIHGRL